ncbi:MAG TPA: GntR family transcriptional regulator [Longimicrobiales bacterium]|nr:GntR family transcriptional regulator [Longimicrobiales bacterium]
MLDRLRERILLGRYFGCWSPGDRLPSVRDVALLEEVDRKTAAAAYRHLEQEGLVQVAARSGVYLRSADSREESGDPLRRLHRQWLEQTLTAATELGLDSSSVARMLHAVAAVESHRIPVVDDDDDHAALLARELITRTGLDCAGCRVRDLPAHSGPLREAPFAVATPTMSLRLRPRQHHLPVVHATLAPELLDEVRDRARRGPVVVVVGTEGLARELGQALEHGLVGPASRIRVERASAAGDGSGLGADGAQVVVWPGAPAWAARLEGAGNGRQLVAEQTVREMRRQVARAALEYVNRSTAA